MFYDRYISRFLATTFLIVLPFLVNHVEMACINYPISTSNFTICDDQLCYYTQTATTSMDFKIGQSSCIQYSAPDITSNIYFNNVTIVRSNSIYPYDNCYYTDDFLLFSNCICNCPLGFSGASGCPCPVGDTSYPSSQVCARSIVSASGCPVGQTTNACCKVGISITPRYYVCSVSPNLQLDAEIQVSDGSQVCTFTLVDTNAKFTCGSLNLTISQTNFKSNYPGNFVIYDTINSETYFSSSSNVNGINENDPTKFGSIKIDSNSLISIPTNFNLSLLMTAINCYDNNIMINNPTPTLADIHPSSLQRNFEEIPTLDTGFAFYDRSNILYYVGLKDNNLLLGPNTNTYPVPVNNTLLSVSNSTLCVEYGANPYLNTSCTVTIITPNIPYTNFYKWSFSKVQCPGVTYYGTAYITSDQVIVTNCWGSIEFSGYIYPNKETLVSRRIYLAEILNPFSSLAPTKRGPQPTGYVIPNKAGSFLLTYEYSGTGLQFNNQNIKPLFESIQFYDNNIVANIKSLEFKGSCLINSQPPIFDDKSIQISPIPTSYNLPIYNIDFNSNVTITVSCGKYSAKQTIVLDVKAKLPDNTHENLSFSNWNNSPWYYNMAKVAPILAGTLVGGILIFFILKYLFREKTMSSTETMVDYLKKMNRKK